MLRALYRVLFFVYSLGSSSSNKIFSQNLTVCRVISPKAGWILIQCWHQMRIPTHPCTRIYLHMHTQARTHTYTYSTPHTTTARCTKPGVEWGRVASSFPPPYCTQPGNDEVHYLAKVGSTNLIYLHHQQADSKN
jgi:hypothetical protein